MLKKALMLFFVPLYIVAAPLENISPIDTGYTWEYEFTYMWGGHFLENGHEYTTMKTRRVITVDSMRILPGSESPDSTIYFLTVYDSGQAYIAIDSSGSTVFDTLYFDTISSIKDSVIYTQDTVITFCEIFLQNYKTDAESLSLYTKGAMDSMKSKIEFDMESLDVYIEQYEQFDGQQYDKREFYFIEDIGATYLYNISSFFCAVQEYYYNLISFNGEPVIDTTNLFDQIGKYQTSLNKYIKIKDSFNGFIKSDYFKIFNAQGKLVYSSKTFNKPIITDKLSKGNYLITGYVNSKLNFKKKFTIK